VHDDVPHPQRGPSRIGAGLRPRGHGFSARCGVRDRVPLLRPGFRPNGPYEVSFVFMLSGTPFARKGGSELALPSMDVPISLLEWELFLPEQYKVKDFGGDAIAASLLPAAMAEPGYSSGFGSGYTYATGSFGTPQGVDQLSLFVPAVPPGPMQPGQIGGIVIDPQGAVISGAEVKVTSLENGASTTTTTDGSGQWVVAAGMSSGRLRI